MGELKGIAVAEQQRLAQVRVEHQKFIEGLVVFSGIVQAVVTQGRVQPLEQGFRRRVVPELQHLVPVLGHGQFFIAVAPDGHECRALLLGEAGDGGFVRLIAGHS